MKVIEKQNRKIAMFMVGDDIHVTVIPKVAMSQEDIVPEFLTEHFSQAHREIYGANPASIETKIIKGPAPFSGNIGLIFCRAQRIEDLQVHEHEIVTSK